MEKSFLNYFLNLNKTYSHTNGVFSSSEINPEFKFRQKFGLDYVSIDDTPFYAKEMTTPKAWGAYASSKLYNKIGMNTPPQFIIKDNHCTTENKYFAFSQDITSIKNLNASIATKELNYPLFQLTHKILFPIIPVKKGRSDKWDILTNRRLQKFFLNYMTPECLDKLIGMFLLDELRTDIDRHTGNYFLTRDDDYGLFDDVVVIDLDNMHILHPDFTHGQHLFKRFLDEYYLSYTPVETKDLAQQLSDRTRRIVTFIEENKISKNNVKLLKSALECDVPEPLRTIRKRIYDHRHKLNIDTAYDALSRLWEYNRNALGRELEL